MTNTTTNKSVLALLLGGLVHDNGLSAAEAEAVLSCAEVGYEGAPDDVAAAAARLMAPPNRTAVVVVPLAPASWQAAFPDFGPMPLKFPSGWEDESGHNDACPTFAFATARGDVLLYVDYADPAQRELSGVARFRADLVDDEGQTLLGAPDAYLWETEDPGICMDCVWLVTLREEVRDWQEALCGERDLLDELCAQIDERFYSASPPVSCVEFVVGAGGPRSSLESMLAANGEDEEVCVWLRAARPGDVYESMHAETVRCVAAER